MPHGRFQFVVALGVFGLLSSIPAGFVHRFAGLLDSGQAVFLQLRAGPLYEIDAVMPAGVPGSCINGHFAKGSVSIDIVVNEARLNGALAFPGCVQQFIVKSGPEVTAVGGIAEPAAVIAVRAGDD